MFLKLNWNKTKMNQSVYQLTPGQEKSRNSKTSTYIEKVNKVHTAKTLNKDHHSQELDQQRNN